MIEMKEKKLYCSCEHYFFGSWSGNFNILGNIIYDI